MKNKEENKYRIIVPCHQCGKIITIDFMIHIEETPKYGKSRSFIPDKLPLYLRGMFETGERFLKEYYPDNPWMPHPPKNREDREEYFPLCSECLKLKKLKE